MPAPARPPTLAGRVFRGRDVVAAGLLTRDQLSSKAWRRLFRGVYADAALPETHEVAVRGAALIVPPSAVFAGRSAAYLVGAEMLADARTPVEVIVPEADRFGPVDGLRIRRADLPESHVRSVRRFSCTAPVRTALDLARFEELPESVVALDVLLRAGLLLPTHLSEAAAELSPGRGTRRATRAIALADGRSESPQESRLRVVLRLAGLVPEPQYVVRDADGRFVARVDLAFPEQRVAVEYDGAWHGRAGQLARDRRRLNALVAAGWTVLHVTAADLHDPEALVRSVKLLIERHERGVLRLSAADERRISPRSTTPATGRARRS